MSDLAELPTPALILDRGKLERNLARMRSAVSRHGVALRPHLKTAKSAQVAELAVAGAERVITVSTIEEAEYFASHGFNDILLAVSITPHKLRRVAAIGANTTVLTDRLDVAIEIARSGLPALIEIDCGEHRGGLLPDVPLPSTGRGNEGEAVVRLKVRQEQGAWWVPTLTPALSPFRGREIECLLMFNAQYGGCARDCGEKRWKNENDERGGQGRGTARPLVEGRAGPADWHQRRAHPG
jgi:hypothetical protein